MKLAFATTAFLGALCGAGAAFADYYGNAYSGAWLGEQLRYDRPSAYWTDMVSRPPRHVEPASRGPRTWDARDQNPWANTYGTPAEEPARATSLRPGARYAIPVCTCYLPADARSWDGGPLTDADIARLCRAQCF
jgi:hypothetical protein